MTDKGKATQETTFDASSCMGMMEKMKGRHMEGCDCAEMLSLFAGKDAPPDMQKMMSQMESCCGIGNEEAASQ